jgi:small subunit ribosomal protein S21e
LAANDFGAVQITVADIDPTTGTKLKTSSTYAISGFIRGHSEGDEALTSLAKNA